MGHYQSSQNGAYYCTVVTACYWAAHMNIQSWGEGNRVAKKQTIPLWTGIGLGVLAFLAVFFAVAFVVANGKAHERQADLEQLCTHEIAAYVLISNELQKSTGKLSTTTQPEQCLISK